MLRVTINDSGSLHFDGHMQFIANLVTRGGGVFTEGGTLFLHNGWEVGPTPPRRISSAS